MNDTKNFELLSKTAEIDQGPGQYRIGLVALSNDYLFWVPIFSKDSGAVRVPRRRLRLAVPDF